MRYTSCVRNLVGSLMAYQQGLLKESFSGTYFIDNNGNGTFDVGETKLADVRLFISCDGAYLLQQHEALKSIADDEIAVFLEIPEGDIYSGDVFLIKAGKNAQQHVKSFLKEDWVTPFSWDFLTKHNGVAWNFGACAAVCRVIPRNLTAKNIFCC